MVKIYYDLIVAGEMKLSEVNAKWRNDVKVMLAANGHSDLIDVDSSADSKTSTDEETIHRY